ncbi:MAG: SIS domain-containing protein [Vulcanimicrobiota bacterium]
MMLYQKGGAVFAEIQDQPRLWKEVLQSLHNRRQELQTWLKSENFGQVLFIGTGDAYGVALSAAHILQLVSGLNTVALPASEILYLRRPPYDSRIKTLVVALSTNGECEDTHWALEKLRKLHTTCRALFIGGAVGKLGNPLTEQQILINDCLEEGPVATRCPSSMLLACMIITAWISDKEVFMNELVKLPDAIDFKSLQDQLQKAATIKPLPMHVTFLGSGPYLGAAVHGSLKVREMAAIGAEYQNPLEYRHGSHCWLTNQTMVVTLVSDTFRDAELRTTFQLASTRAPRLLVSEQLDMQAQMRVDQAVQLASGVSEISRILLMFPVVQLLAFYMAISKGKNPDKPKHLEAAIEIKERPGV